MQHASRVSRVIPMQLSIDLYLSIWQEAHRQRPAGRPPQPGLEAPFNPDLLKAQRPYSPNPNPNPKPETRNPNPNHNPNLNPYHTCRSSSSPLSTRQGGSSCCCWEEPPPLGNAAASRHSGQRRKRLACDVCLCACVPVCLCASVREHGRAR